MLPQQYQLHPYSLDLKKQELFLRACWVIRVLDPLELVWLDTLRYVLVVEREVDKLLDLVSKDNLSEVGLPLS